MRGNALSQAAKCIVLMVKIGKKITKYVLAVVPGDTRVDLNAVKALMKGTYVSFASPDIAEKLAGSVAGTVLPFSFHPELELVVDPSLLANDELYFNTARLDRSMVLKTSDYMALAKPRLERIAEARATVPGLVAGSGGHQGGYMGSQAPYAISLDVRYGPLQLGGVHGLVA